MYLMIFTYVNNVIWRQHSVMFVYIIGFCHVSHCNLAGNIIAWELPRENKLATISYYGGLLEGGSSSRIEDPTVLPPPAPALPPQHHQVP